jgi:hypothetical protein
MVHILSQRNSNFDIQLDQIFVNVVSIKNCFCELTLPQC